MEILNQAMEFTQQYSLFFLAGMFAVILILVICMTVMNSRMKELQAAYDDFMRGNDGKSLEGILKTVVEDNKRVKIQCKRDIDEIISMKVTHSAVLSHKLVPVTLYYQSHLG